jgi:hypothetical protein
VEAINNTAATAPKEEDKEVTIMLKERKKGKKEKKEK